MGRVVDVQLVDLPDRRGADPDRERPCPDLGGEAFPLDGRKSLRVADAGDPVTSRPHHDGGRHDSATGRRHADFINAHDPAESFVPEAALVAKSRDDRSHRPES
jgi:hypothetical protein